MNKIYKILSVHSRNGKIRIFINPEKTEIRKLLDAYETIRFLYSKTTDNYYVANAYGVIHKDILKTAIEYGLETGKEMDVFDEELYDSFTINKGNIYWNEDIPFVFGTKASVSWYGTYKLTLQEMQARFNYIRQTVLKDIVGEYDERRNAIFYVLRKEDKDVMAMFNIHQYEINEFKCQSFDKRIMPRLQN